MTDLTVRVCMNAVELMIFAIVAGFIGALIPLVVKR